MSFSKLFNSGLTIGQRYQEFEKKPKPVLQHCSSVSSSQTTVTTTSSTSTSTSSSSPSTTPKILNGLAAAASNNTSTPVSAGAATASGGGQAVLIEVSEFSSRIQRLRFIDDSASSTALTSPAESLLHLNHLPGCAAAAASSVMSQHHKRSHVPLQPSIKHHRQQQQQQHRYLDAALMRTSTSSSRTVSLPSSSCSASQASTPPRVLPPSHNLMQRQPNIESSTETLCSDLAENQSTAANTSAKSGGVSKGPVYQHEQLGASLTATPSRLHHHHHYKHPDHDFDDDEEIKSIISATQNQASAATAASGVAIQSSRYLISNGYNYLVFCFVSINKMNV